MGCEQSALSGVVDFCCDAFATGINQRAYDHAVPKLAKPEPQSQRGLLALYAGRAAWRLKRPQSSLAHFSSAVVALSQGATDTALFAARLDYGLALYERGRHKAALEQYFSAKTLAIADPAARRVLDRRIAALFIDEGRYVEAEALLGPDPSENASVSDRLAWLNYHLLLAERTGRIADAQMTATAIRSIWDDHAANPLVQKRIGALLNALRVDGILRGEAFVRDALNALAEAPPQLFSLNSYIRVEVLRASLAREAGRLDDALATIERAIVRGMRDYDGLPADLLVMQREILHELGRGEDFLQSLDALMAGALTRGQFPFDQITAETSPLLITLMDDPAIGQMDPSFAARGAETLVRLIATGLPADLRWQAYACLARVAPDPRGQILLAKLACQQVMRTAATALSFASARAAFVRARLAPFHQAVDLLYQAGRLHEGRHMADLLRSVKRQMGCASDLTETAAPHVPLTEAEEVVLQTGPQRFAWVLDDTLWPDDRLASQPAPGTCSIGSTTLRFSKTDGGYRRDVSGALGSDRSLVDWTEGALTARVADLLQALEAGDVATDAAAVLYRVLIAPVADLLPHREPVVIHADGVLAALPFRAVFPPQRSCDIVYGVGEQGHMRVNRAYRSAVHLVGTDDLSGSNLETAALRKLGPVASQPFTVGSLKQALSDATDILHISCHFELDPAQPRRSRFATMPGEPDLTAADVWDLIALQKRHSPRLVFLAFCDSGFRGDPADFPGVLLAQGVDAVIAAAWKIPEFEATRFACALYTHLSAGFTLTTAFAKAEDQTRFYGFKLFMGAGSPGQKERPDR